VTGRRAVRRPKIPVRVSTQHPSSRTTTMAPTAHAGLPQVEERTEARVAHQQPGLAAVATLVDQRHARPALRGTFK